MHSAEVHEIANAPSLMMSNYEVRPLKPGDVRQNATNVLRAYPEADVLLVGNNGTPFAVRGNFGKYADSAHQMDVKSLASFLPTLARFFELSVDNLVFLSKANDPIGMAHFAFQGQAWNLSALTSATTSVGAFPLTNGSADSAMLVELPPGLYTAIVGGGSGVTLVEVYEVP